MSDATVIELNEDCCGTIQGCTIKTNGDGIASYDRISTLDLHLDCKVQVEKNGYKTAVEQHSFDCPKNREVSTEVEVVLEPIQ